MGLSFSAYIVQLVKKDNRKPSEFELSGTGTRIYRVTPSLSNVSLNETPVSSIPPAVMERLTAIRAAEAAVDRESQGSKVAPYAVDKPNAKTPRPFATVSAPTKPKP